MSFLKFGSILAQATVAALRRGPTRDMASDGGAPWPVDGQASTDRAARNAAKTQSLVENFMSQLDEMHAEQEQATHSASPDARQ